MRLWIDDVRPMPDDYDLWAKTAIEAKVYIGSNLDITHVSFDHDLGDENGTGYDVACFVEVISESDYWLRNRPEVKPIIKPFTWDIHSANPVGSKRIEQAMKNAERFWNMET